MKKELIALTEPTRLRATTERLLTNTWCHLNTPQEKKVIENDIKRYNELREIMVNIGMAQEDILDYDEKFTNLPWKSQGYESPNILKEGLN